MEVLWGAQLGCKEMAIWNGDVCIKSGNNLRQEVNAWLHGYYFCYALKNA